MIAKIVERKSVESGVVHKTFVELLNNWSPVSKMKRDNREKKHKMVPYGVIQVSRSSRDPKINLKKFFFYTPSCAAEL